jgi:hypothetical protein
MLSLYDGYCATANAASSTATKTSASDGLVETGRASNAALAGGETVAATGLVESGVAPSPDADTAGLSRSDTIALAASLGVGIPSILIAVMTLCVMIKKRNNAQISGQSLMTSSLGVSAAPNQPKSEQQGGVSGIMR